MTDEELAAKAAADLLNQGKTAEQLAAEAAANGGEKVEKSVFERLQELNKPAEQAQTSQVQENRIPAEVAEKITKINEYETTAKEAQSRLKSYEENVFIQAINYGADETKLRQIAKEIAGEDFSKYPYSELVKMDFEKRGLKGDTLEQAVSAKVAEYDSIIDAEKWKKTLLENEIKEKFSASGGESQTLKQLKELAAEREKLAAKNQPVQVTEEQKQAVIQQDLTSLDQAAAEFKSIGLEINPEQIKQFYNEKSITPYLDANDKLNAKQFLLDKYILTNIEQIIKSERDSAVKEYQRANAGLDKNRDSGTASGKQPDQRAQHLVNMGMNPNLINQKPTILND